MRKTAKNLTGIILMTALVLFCIQAALAISGDDYLREYYRKIKVLTPQTYGNITIYPVQGPGKIYRDIMTLDSAASKNMLIISEIDGGRVNELSIENLGDMPVFIMAGEILTGCKQDRILQDDILIPARSGRIVVTAYCVEHGRWTNESDRFSSGKTFAPNAVRMAAKKEKNQQKVWANVAECYKACEVAAIPAGAPAAAPARIADRKSSNSLQRVYEDKNVKRVIDRGYDVLSGLPDRWRNMTGAVVVVNGEIICADLFGDHELLCAYWDKLVRSYCAEAMNKEYGQRGYYAAREDVEILLSRARHAGMDFTGTPGAGSLISLGSNRVSGTALVWGNALLHGDIFPEYNQEQAPPIYENSRKGGFYRDYNRR
ncbi:MAG: hypothetical protein M1269_11245 [Chloroflexi bacterium]|nr:hypothetical protein [Chloroflexota bacterium]